MGVRDRRTRPAGGSGSGSGSASRCHGSQAIPVVCLGGERACPPEDVGGISGYAYFLDAVGDPAHEEHDDYLMWVGGSFDREAFNVAEVNAEVPQGK